MAHTMRHRGPDQGGFYGDTDVSMGHQRLSIIDLSDKGRQPMSNENGTVWIVFNGEIYNHQQLRGWLEHKGHTFTSKTDTEVIVHGYEELGIQVLDKLNGMFAFAIWDTNNRVLFVARDRLGEKPLYYTFQHGNFVFASEIKAILQNPRINPELDEHALYHFLGFEFVPAPRTMFKGIRKLPPGNFLRLSDGKLDQVEYWDLPKGHEQRPRRVWEEELRGRLENAVKLRMQSDVPLGAFLSGGIDSSSVVAMMRRATNGELRTFSLGYQEDTFSEFEYARQVAEHFGTLHTELLIDPVTPEILERAIWHLDEPLSEFSVLPAYLICRKASEHVTVCLSGEGGDEIFAGYDRFKASKAGRMFQYAPASFRAAASHLVNLFPDTPQKKGIINVVKRFIEGSSLPLTGAHMRWQYFLTTRYVAHLFANGGHDDIISESLGLVERVGDRSPSNASLDRELYTELKFMMPDNPLMKIDKMSMAHSLEIRAPFLDHELVEFVSRIPSNLKLQGLKTKAIFKSAMARELPKGIAARAKHGYSFPIKHWFRRMLKGYARELLEESRFLRERFSPTYMATILSQHNSGRYNHSHILWALINLGLWHRCFIENGARTHGMHPVIERPMGQSHRA